MMLLATSDTIPGHEISQTLGLVRGATVRAKHIGTDIVAQFTNLVGGEIKGYSSLLAGSRDQALDRMQAEAAALGADAIVAVRITTSSIGGASVEILAYGTAVKLA